MQIRRGTPEDTGDWVSMLYSAGPGIYEFIYADRRRSAKQYIAYEYRSGMGFCGCRNVTVMAIGREVIATGCVYDGRTYWRLMAGSGLNMLRYFGPIDMWPAVLRSHHMDSVMRAPKRDELYLANFGVAPEHRGRGIGTRMLRHWLSGAVERGYRSMVLDVDDDNEEAQKLYLRLGFRIVRRKAFSGVRPGYEVPGTVEMELRLDSGDNQAFSVSTGRAFR